MADKETLEILLKLQDQLSKGILNATKNVTKMGNKLQKTSQKLKTLGQGMKNVGKNAAVKFAVAGAAVTGLIMVFASYEKQMSKVKAISGATEKEFARLKETARGLGKVTKFSAKEAGEGMEFLALAGYNTNQTIAAMPGLLNLAAAGQLELGKASDLVTDILSQYGLEAEYATNASDLFAKVQATANTNVELLGSAILSVGGTAKNAGVSLEETASIIGLLADQGLKGQAAGTAMNRMILDMVKKSKSLKKMGINVYDLNGEFRKMADIVGDVEKAIAGKTAEEAMAIKMSVTGIFGQQALNRLLQAGSKRMKEFTKASSDNIGVAKKMADTMEDNVIGAFTILKSALQEAMISIGQELMPAIRGLISFVNKLVDRFNNLSPTIKKFIGFSALAVTAILGIVTVLGTLIGSLVILTGVLLANPLSLWILGITALVSAIIYLYKNWDKVVGFFKQTLGYVTAWFVELNLRVAGIAERIGNVFKQLGQIIFYAMTGKFGKIKDAFASLQKDIRNIMGKGRENIKEDETTAQEEKVEAKITETQEAMSAQELINEQKRVQEEAHQNQVLQSKQARDVQAKQKAIKDFEEEMIKIKSENAFRVKSETNKLNFLESLRNKAGIDQIILEQKIKVQSKNLDIAHDNEKRNRETVMQKFSLTTTIKGGQDLISSIISFQKTTKGEYRAFFNFLKGMRIAEAVINTWAGATAALAGPFPMSLINFAIVAAKGLASVATIVATGFATGTAKVLGTGNQDTISSMLTPGEMVVPKSFAESIRAGELSLSGEGNNISSGTSIQVNINDPIFYGDPDIEFVKEIFKIAGEGISRNLIPSLPEG